MDSPGDTVHMSGVDMITGTPVLDIKPYIPDYDCPHTRDLPHMEECDMPSGGDTEEESKCQVTSPCGPSTEEFDAEGMILCCPASSKPDGPSSLGAVLSEVKDYLQQGELVTHRPTEDRPLETESSEMAHLGPKGELADRLQFGEESYSTIASWIRQPPVSVLEVRFTQHAERELQEFVGPQSTGKFVFFFSLCFHCVGDKACANREESGKVSMMTICKI